MDLNSEDNNSIKPLQIKKIRAYYNKNIKLLKIAINKKVVLLRLIKAKLL